MKKTIVTFALTLMFAFANANVIIDNPTSEKSTTETILSSKLNPFCKAIVLGKLDVVAQMIALGEDVNQKCLGKTPAMYAARYNKPEIMKLLIENGADLSVKSDDEKFTAEKFAELSNASEVLQILRVSKEV